MRDKLYDVPGDDLCELDEIVRRLLNLKESIAQMVDKEGDAIKRWGHRREWRQWIDNVYHVASSYIDKKVDELMDIHHAIRHNPENYDPEAELEEL